MSVKLRSSIKSSYKRYVLFRGTLIAVIGALLIVMSGIYLPVQEMRIWGLPALVVGVGLIALGLLPYRRLSRLEDKPNEIILLDKEFQFFTKGKKVFTIPYASIDKIDHMDNRCCYGIALWIKKSPEQKVIVHDKKASFSKKQNGDIFLPNFTERSYEILREHVMEKK